jgi:hypothetical protein
MKKGWKLLASFIFACLIVGLLVWFVLLGTICSEPRVPVAATNHTMQYNCHGNIVYITPLQNALLHWLVPAMFIVMLLLQAVKKRV